MKAFISHASKDQALVRKLAARLGEAGLDVWNPYEEIAPGDNWAMKVGQALEESDLMVIVLSPGAFESDPVQREIEYALSSRKYKDRLITIIVGPTVDASRDVPWILLSQPNKQIDSTDEGVRDAVEEILSIAHEGTSSTRL